MYLNATTLKAAIHKIQNGIENVHGDVEYGERQYLFLFKDWVRYILGEDIEKIPPKQMMYQTHQGLAPKTEPIEVVVWIESSEYQRGYNARAKEILDKADEITKNV